MKDLFGTEITKSAVFSPCGVYRYRLTRRWNAAPPVVFVMLNPSTADDVDNDPTITRCEGFARREGAGGITVVNLYAFKSTEAALLRTVDDPVGPENDRYILEAATEGRLLVVAWGAGVVDSQRPAAVLALLRDYEVFCLGTTDGGEPRHPLMLRRDAELRKYTRGAK